MAHDMSPACGDRSQYFWIRVRARPYRQGIWILALPRWQLCHGFVEPRMLRLYEERGSAVAPVLKIDAKTPVLAHAASVACVCACTCGQVMCICVHVSLWPRVAACLPRVHWMPAHLDALGNCVPPQDWRGNRVADAAATAAALLARLSPEVHARRAGALECLRVV